MKGNTEMPSENKRDDIVVQAIRAMSEELIEVEKSISRLRQRLSTIIECSDRREKCDALSRLTHPTSAKAETQKPALALVSASSDVTQPELECDVSSSAAVLEDNDHDQATHVVRDDDAAAEDCEKACSALIEDETAAFASLEPVDSDEAISRVFGGPLMDEHKDSDATAGRPTDTEVGQTDETCDDALTTDADDASLQASDETDGELLVGLKDDEDTVSSDEAPDVAEDDLVWETCDGSTTPEKTVTAASIEPPAAEDNESCEDAETSNADDLNAELAASVKDDEAIAFTEAVSDASEDDIIEDEPATDTEATFSSADDNDDADDEDAAKADVTALIPAMPVPRPHAPSRSWAHIAAVAVAFAMVAAAAATSPELRAFAFQL